MSASQKPPSGQGNPTPPLLTRDVHDSIAYADLQRRVADCLEPFSSVLSRVENEQFQDGSLDSFIANNSINEHPNNSGLETPGCDCSRDASGRHQVCNYCSDATTYGIVARAFDQRVRPPNQDLPLYQWTGEPVQQAAFWHQPVSHHEPNMSVNEGLFLSPPPLGPQPLSFGNPNSTLFNSDHVPYLLNDDDDDNDYDDENAQGQRRDREGADPDEEDIGGVSAEREREDPHLPAERAHTDTFHLPLFEGTNEGNLLEGTLATTEEQARLSVTRRGSYFRPASAEASSSRIHDPQSEEASKPPSTPRYGEGGDTLIEPPVSQAPYDPWATDCYSCNGLNTSEDMVACDSVHGSQGRWFHLSCAGLAKKPSADETWFCGDCSNPGGPDEDDNTLYQDDAEPTDSGDQVDSGEKSKGKQKEDPGTRKFTSSADSYDNDENDVRADYTTTRKRPTKQDLDPFIPSESDDDSNDGSYSRNSRKRRRQHEPKAKQSSGISKGPAHPRKAPATSGLTISSSIAANQVDSDEKSKGKQKEDPGTRKFTSSADSYDNDDNSVRADYSTTRKRPRKQDLPTSESDDDSNDVSYSGNSSKRRRQHEPKAKQSSKGPAHPQNTPATSGLTISSSIPAITPAPAAIPGNTIQLPDGFPPERAGQVHVLMKEVIAAGVFSEKKFRIISDRMAERHGDNVSHGAIKNFWNRTGRLFFGLDERRTPNPNKMVTGVQSPEDRRKARQLAKAK